MSNLYQEIVNLLEGGGKGVVATVISSQGSAPQRSQAKMLIREDGTSCGTVGGGRVEHKVRERAVEVLESGESQLVHFDLSGKDPTGSICGGQMDVFLEAVLPDESLYIFGAGHISGSTAAFAKSLGFRVVVIDPRVEYNNPDRFPDADELIVEEYGEAFTKLQVDDQSYIVIVTRGHALDELCLEFAVGTRAKYIGMIGSKKKIREGNQRLLENGVSQKQLDRIHAPVGLEIGAETPEEIAISIMAQVIQTRRTAAD